MPFYLRKSVNFGLFRLNFSKSGVGVSFGVPGARISFGPQGTTLHAGRGGVYYRKRLRPASQPKQSSSRSPSNMAGEMPTEQWIRMWAKASANFEHAMRQAPHHREYRQKETPMRESMQEQSAYAILGVKEGASAEELSTTYRALAQQYHPDKVAHLASEFRELADRKMKTINEAYTAIKAGKRTIRVMVATTTEEQSTGDQSEGKFSPEELLAGAKRFVEQYPDDPQSYWLLGMAYDLTGSSRAAIIALSQALARDPTYIDALGVLHAILARAGTREAALAEYQAVQRLIDSRFTDKLLAIIYELYPLPLKRTQSSPSSHAANRRAQWKFFVGYIVVIGLIKWLSTLLPELPTSAINSTIGSPPQRAASARRVPEKSPPRMTDSTRKPPSELQEVAKSDPSTTTTPQAPAHPPGLYRILHDTELRRTPEHDAESVTSLPKDIKVRVVDSFGDDWLKVESKKADRPGGYVWTGDVAQVEE